VPVTTAEPYDPELQVATSDVEDLPDDDEEFASPFDVPELNGRVDAVPAP
jgi:hypothetical protein